MNTNSEFDFGGWATKNDIKCSDGRTIKKNAFIENDGQKVPLVWNHQHDDPSEVLGHALLENREDGVYAYGKFNDTESGKQAKALVANGDVDRLSIYANKLKSQNGNVMHGCIREVSLVLAGANPGAYIDSVILHSDDTGEDEEEGVIETGEYIESIDSIESDESTETIEHADNEKKIGGNKMEETEKVNDTKKEKTVKEVFDTLSEEQKEAVYAIIGSIVENQEGEEDMKHNAFENDYNEEEEVLAHSEIMADAIKDAKRYGSLRESVIEHAAINNIQDINKLFPDATELNPGEPPMIEKDRSWVAKVMNDVKHTPFSRVKTTFGKMKEDQARAKGYIKGNKKDVTVQLLALNRITTPTTVYSKSEIDRDDVLDITDFDVIAWQKKEMRKQLDKDLALAMLLGDGREPMSDGKINEENIRPVIKDNDMYTISYTVKKGVDYNNAANSASNNDSEMKGVIRAAVKSRKEYQGSGKPTFYTTENLLTDLLLIEDQNGRRIYETEEKLALALRVKDICTIPEMEAAAYKDVYGVIVNMADYTAGADKGGSVNMFDDFDIDYNQMKYLIETRMSGALTKPHSAIVLKKESASEAASESPIAG